MVFVRSIPFNTKRFSLTGGEIDPEKAANIAQQKRVTMARPL
jgi:hypothetical protein